MNNKIEIDIRIGGLGDIWMRLVSFYIIASIRPHIDISLVVPSNMYKVAVCTFSPRLHILTSAVSPTAIYTNLGLRNVLPSSLRGKRFVAPYGRVVINDWNKWSSKDYLNLGLYALADRAGLVYSPPWPSLKNYQGYSELVSLPLFRSVSFDQFTQTLALEYNGILNRLLNTPQSKQFSLNSVKPGRVVVFPTGTGRQFMPLDWAKLFLPDALFAFFYKDPEIEKWASAGLDTITYFVEPGDIVALANLASVTITTDSFPSHLLQYNKAKLIVLLTELPRHRVISPSFNGWVVDATAPCHPCPHLERRGFPTCKAGYINCLNWSSMNYTKNIQDALSNALSSQTIF